MSWVVSIIDVRNMLDDAIKKLYATGNSESVEILMHSFRGKVPQWQVDDAQFHKFYLVNYPLLEGERVEIQRGEPKTDANSVHRKR